MAEDSGVLSVADVDVLVEFPIGRVAGDAHHHLRRHALGDGQRSEGSAGSVRGQRLELGDTIPLIQVALIPISPTLKSTCSMS